MLQQLINHSPDLRRLTNDGYALELKSGYLVIRHIPYLNSRKEICFGSLVSELTLAGTVKTGRPRTHVIHFAGEYPCDLNSNKITAIQHASAEQKLAEGLIIQHSFSNKPIHGYADYYQKVTRYAEIISAPAMALNPEVSAKIHPAVKDSEELSPLQYVDTHTSRCNLYEITSKLKGQKIAIIGLGGTGSYILDAIAKTPVAEIHIYDGDFFFLHNAFRSPGAASKEVLDKQMKKVDYYRDIYSNFHKKIIAHPYYMISEKLSELYEMSYVFVAVDRPEVKENWMEYFIAHGISFIDVGMGIVRADNQLLGILRVTTGVPHKSDHIKGRISTGEHVEDDYHSSIQISELNSMNAAMAVMKWKKLSGFYQDLEKEYHTTYSINVSLWLNEDNAA